MITATVFIIVDIYYWLKVFGLSLFMPLVAKCFFEVLLHIHQGIIVWELLTTGFTLLKYFLVITIEHESHYE